MFIESELKIQSNSVASFRIAVGFVVTVQSAQDWLLVLRTAIFSLHRNCFQHDAKTPINEIEFAQIRISQAGFWWNEILAIDLFDIDIATEIGRASCRE